MNRHARLVANSLAQRHAEVLRELAAVQERLADRELRLRDYRSDKVARGLRWASIEREVSMLRERNANQAELIRNFRAGSLSEVVGYQRYAALNRLIRALWASRRRHQQSGAVVHQAGEVVIIDLPDGDQAVIVGDRVHWGVWR